ncbi:MAG: hypothetical protein CVU71_17365, partial [Deltaproteobacteria bacterium HGW-Deltaproteobacteria-6]
AQLDADGYQVLGTSDADTLNGNNGMDTIYGYEGNDMITGAYGNDYLDGGTGADGMLGGSGNDTYVVDDASDVVTENVGAGIDTVKSSMTYALSANVENMTLTGIGAVDGAGNELNNYLKGNSVANTLTGNAGNDIFDGGQGNDVLVGGTGNDAYTFRRTDGEDTINDYSTITTDVDTLKMTDGISSTEPVIVKQDGDLYIFVDTGNYVKIASQFSSNNYGIERLEVSDGHYVTRQDIEIIVNTMSEINNSGMDVMQKFNAMMADHSYISTLAQTWQQI